MEINGFYDKRTNTITYVVHDPDSKDAVIIDPVLDYEPASSTISHESVDKVCAFVNDNKLKPHFVLETHAHADHLSAAQVLKQRYPAAVLAVGTQITEVQKAFRDVFDLPADFPVDGRQFDRLLAHGETIAIGTLTLEVIHTPGHTPACATYKFEDAIFTGDSMFMPDFGTGRCDFPAGSARQLYQSITQRLYTLPDETRVFVGHDYQPGGRELDYQTSIGEQKKNNIQLRGDTSEADFVKFRTERDKDLGTPRLLFQSVQVNVDAGTLPAPHGNEVRYLKIPVNIFRPTEDPDNGEIVEKNV